MHTPPRTHRVPALSPGVRSAVHGMALALTLFLLPGCESPETVAPPENLPYENFQRSDFDASSTNITNPWLSFVPGTRFVYEGFTVEGGVDVPHRVEINVTNLTKEIDGVKAIVTWDLDYSNGVLVEAELAFFAQDKFGNVWRMGEYPEEYEDGEIVAAPTWIHSFANAVAGISMLADPQLGTASYSQGWGPGVGFTDRGVVDQVGLTVDAAGTTYENVLVIAESATGEPGEQLKYFASGAGNVLVGFRGEGEQSRERLELIETVTLTAQQQSEVCVGAFALEASAYQQRPAIYGRTAPMQTPGGGSCP